jgi:hypothetical protein
MVATAYTATDMVPLSGGTMTGTLVLAGSPAVSLPSSSGTVTLNGTTAVSVSATAVDSSTVILLTVQPGSAPAGTPYVASVTAGTGFTVKSTSSGDTAVVVGWVLVG